MSSLLLYKKRYKIFINEILINSNKSLNFDTCQILKYVSFLLYKIIKYKIIVFDIRMGNYQKIKIS